MYESFFQLNERPFSITPNPRFVFLSQRHQDALAHLLYGVGTGGSGGFVQLTGEVGTGKTTLCRLALEQVPEKTRIALILNPMLGPLELLEAICDEFEIDWASRKGSGVLRIHGALNQYLLERHSAGERVVLIIDEAQNLSEAALEQIRLLTNLETATDKLLQIILIGQPELRDVIRRPSLRQLAQRITARFHLEPLDKAETIAYIKHRLLVAGAPRSPFTQDALEALFEASGGIPRLVNIIADRALLAGFSQDQDSIDRTLVKAAAAEVTPAESRPARSVVRGALAVMAVLGLMLAGLLLAWLLAGQPADERGTLRPVWQEVLLSGQTRDGWAEAASIWIGLGAEEVSEACRATAIATDGVACLKLRGSWSYLQSVDMPVVLVLAQTQLRHVLLVGVSGQVAYLRYEGQNYRVPIAELERFWRGEFAVIWPDSGLVSQLGDRGAEILLLKQQAADLGLEAWSGPVDDVFDVSFQEWIRAWQVRHGLSDDGAVGPATRLFLRYPQVQLQDRALIPLDLTTAGAF